MSSISSESRECTPETPETPELLLQALVTSGTTVSSEVQIQALKLPTPPPPLTVAVLSFHVTKPGSHSRQQQGHQLPRQSPRCSNPAPPHCRDKKVIAKKKWGTLQWFNVRDATESASSTAMVRKTYSYIGTYLGGVVVRETKMGFDVKGEEGAEAADATGSGGVPVTASTYAADRNHQPSLPKQ